MTIFLSSHAVRADSTSTYFTASTLHARAIAMGGAFTAVEAGLESALFNPASMGIESYPDKSLNVYLNPVGGMSAALNSSQLSSRKLEGANDWLSAVGIFARAISYSKPVFQASLVLSEDLLGNPQKLNSTHVVSTHGILDWNYHTAAARITLAKQVSLGVTGYSFNMLDDEGDLRTRFGSSYGILMKPSDTVSAGVSYYYFPEQADSLMLLQHRISNKSINIGLVYRPVKTLVLALDFRNVSEEDNNSTNEVHAGIEFIPTHFLAIRSGYFRQNNEIVDTFSAGFGISDFRPYRSPTDHFVFSNIILNYGLQVEKKMNELDFIHNLTFLIRF